MIEAGPSDETARLYVCGITPYDATHMGHASTYVAFDTLQRVWRDAGYAVRYTQNITDVDDPLFERANATGVDWRELGESQVELFRNDMVNLQVIPPDDFIGVTEVVDDIARAVQNLVDRGLAYEVAVDDDSEIAGTGTRRVDIYFDNTRTEQETEWRLGQYSNYDETTMLRLSAERGGDPERPGKRDPLDPLLWKAQREGEPSWPSTLGAGRPGWHIECSVIALESLGRNFDVQGGGTDLIFPHHEFSAGHATALSGAPLAKIFSHSGMVAYHGEKMSKSLGNLVLVSRLIEGGVDPRAIRLVILSQHYRSDWEWTDRLLADSFCRLGDWLAAFTETADAGPRSGATPASAISVVNEMREALNHDLDTPAAIAVVDGAVRSGVDDPGLLAAAVNALLGVNLER